MVKRAKRGPHHWVSARSGVQNVSDPANIQRCRPRYPVHRLRKAMNLASKLIPILALFFVGCCPDGVVCPDLPSPREPIPTTGHDEPQLCEGEDLVCLADKDCPEGLSCVVTAKGPEELKRCLKPCEKACPCPGDSCQLVSGGLFCLEMLAG